MSEGIADFVQSTDDTTSLDLKVMNVEYTESSYGTLIHVFGRDEHGERHHVEISGHNPSLYIRKDAYNQRVENHYAVHDCEHTDEHGEPYTNLYGEKLVRVYATVPDDIRDLRDLFAETWEADVRYEKRWLIDTGVYDGIRIDTTNAQRDKSSVEGDMRVSQKDVEPLSRDETPRVEPKQTVIDIEVGSEDGVPDTDTAEWPVTTIVGWDSDTEAYYGWLYIDESCEYSDVQRAGTGIDMLSTFHDESAMLHDFNEWLAERETDILTGWFSNDFDIPYLVNRSKQCNVYNYQDWSPLGEVYLPKYDPVISGVSCIDMLGAYKKTQIHKLTSKKLDAIAAKELGKEKVAIDEGHTEMWRTEPETFLEYNKVDVQLVHQIDDAVGAINLLDNLKSVVGCSYTDPIGGNIDMMDVLFLRKADEYGYVLPTATKPTVGDYHGAYVFTPKAGLHEHVAYPDYSSLYPNMMYQCNISPETLVGTKDELEESEYTEEDCVWTYVDTETPPPQKSDVDVEASMMEKLYFVKPSIEEGFIRSVLDDVMGLADQYTGGMYAAVKRVRNSTYGVMGDSESYNRGFRLFDWRLAEGTTLGGQKVLKAGADTFLDEINTHHDGADEAYLVGGDTDSVMTAMPFVADDSEALDVATDAASEVNTWLDSYAVDTFGLETEADARMELEIESIASRLFFKGENGGTSDDGVKKRYVQRIVWDDDNMWLDEPTIGIKGFEYVRSDVAAVTQNVQYAVFKTLMEDGADVAAQNAVELTTETITAAMEGETCDHYSGLQDLGIPFGISQSLVEYGSTDRTPQPQYRGAKYANDCLYGDEAISEGDKPLYYYVNEGETGPLRNTYSATTAEDGRYVDSIAVLDASDVPDGMEIDRQKMVQKTIISPLEEIFTTMGWDTTQLETAMERATPPSYYRDDGQTGLDAAEFM